MNIVLDSSVYIAAFLSKELASDILLQGEDRKINIYISNEILEEVKDKLANKFKVDDERIRQYSELIEKCTERVVPKQKLDIVKADPDDNKILECAVTAKANLIVSMDKHLIKLKSYEGIGIVHPKTLTWIIPKILS